MKSASICVFGSLLATSMVLAETQGSPVRGRVLFAQCAGCHSSNTNEKKLGPSLKALFKHSKLENGNPVTDRSVDTQLRKGSKGMPGFAEDLSDRDFADLLAYLKTL